MKFEPVDGCPAPVQIVPLLKRVKEKTGVVYTSIYRGSDPGAASILKRFGKLSQSFLYRAYWILHLPGYRPANRPGESTHELFSDGVAYPFIPRGFPLPFAYMVGIDSSSGVRVAAAMNDEGFDAMLTYPNNPLESQHTNLRKQPRVFKKIRAKYGVLKQGSRGRGVKKIRKQLAYIHDPNTKKPYLDKGPKHTKNAGFFGKDLEKAVKRFQNDHHQKEDGIVGRQTRRQLAHSVRVRKNRLKEKKNG